MKISSKQIKKYRILSMKCAITIGLVSCFSCASAFATKAFDKELLEQPIFAGDNIRGKKLLFGTLGFAFQLGGANHSHSKNGDTYHSLNWGNLMSVGFIADIGMNITDRLWLNIYQEATWGVAGDANLSNTTSYSGGGYASAQYNNARQNQYELKAVIGYDILRFSKIDISMYGGLMYKLMSYDTNPGNVSDGITLLNPANSPNSKIVHNFNIITAVLGIQEKYYTESAIFSAFQEGYIGGIINTGFNNGSLNDFGHAGHNAYWNMSSMPTLGFAIGATAEFALGYGLYLKPFVKYQMIFMTKMTESNDPSGSGYFNLWSATTGIGISWN